MIKQRVFFFDVYFFFGRCFGTHVVGTHNTILRAPCHVGCVLDLGTTLTFGIGRVYYIACRQVVIAGAERVFKLSILSSCLINCQILSGF